MNSRQLSFYVDLSDLPRITRSFSDEVLPAFHRIPGFLGATLLKSDVGERTEIVANSFWNGGMDGSEEVSAQVVNEIIAATGRNPSRRAFDILYAHVEESLRFAAR